MIQKLKRKIILMNMVMVGVILFAMVCVICISSYRNQMDLAKNGLMRVVSDYGTQPSNRKMDNMPNFSETGSLLEIFFGGRGQKEPFMQQYVLVLVSDEDESMTLLNDTDSTMVEETEIKEAVNLAFSDGRESGQLLSRGLMYAKQEREYGTLVAFCDTTQTTQSVFHMAAVGLGVLILAMGVIFFISRMLADVAIRPAEKSWQQQKQFVADASHELKTPLTVILANNNILMTHSTEPVSSQRQWLESTEEEAAHMKHLIDQMLYLAKSDAQEEIPWEMKDTDLSNAVMGVLLNFDPVAYEKGVELDPAVDEGIHLISNESGFSQLVRILTDNAIKYSSRGETVTVSLYREKEKVVLSVRNYGEVISPEDLGHIFERFYRTDKSRNSEGYGLGLAIARSTAERLKGKISVTSSAEDGTVFRVEFAKSKLL